MPIEALMTANPADMIASFVCPITISTTPIEMRVMLMKVKRLLRTICAKVRVVFAAVLCPRPFARRSRTSASVSPITDAIAPTFQNVAPTVAVSGPITSFV